MRPDHPLFRKPNRVTSLAGAISYDTLTYAGEGWTVLARDAKGQPAVVEAETGQGRIVLVQPSVDRYIAGTVQPEGSLEVEQCRRFMRNVVAYLQGEQGDGRPASPNVRPIGLDGVASRAQLRDELAHGLDRALEQSVELADLHRAVSVAACEAQEPAP